MNTRLRKVLRVSMFAFTLLFATSFIATACMGISDFEKSKQLQNGYEDAFIHTVENYKNQKFALEVEFGETVPSDYEVYVFCVPKSMWYLVRDNASLNLNDIPAENYIYNQTAVKSSILVGENIVIPDWGSWAFVFLNLNGDEMTAIISMSHQHVLWWLWIVIPTLVVAGLVTYGVVENVTKYERAKMDSEKAMSKLGVKSEAQRQRAAYWLISNGTEEDLAQLKLLLKDENPLARANSAFAIGGIAKRIGDKSLGAVLKEQYAVETNDMVKEEIVDALCDVADESSLDILAKYIQNDHNEILRFDIAEALEEIASKDSIQILVDVINADNTDSLKIACRRALEKIAKQQNTTADALIKKHTK